MGETFRRSLQVHMLNAAPNQKRPKMGRYMVYSLAFLLIVFVIWHLLN